MKGAVWDGSTGFAGEGVGEHQPPSWIDLEIGAVVGVVVPLGIAHNDQAGAARTHIELCAGCRPWSRGEPAPQQRRLGPGAINR